MNKVSLSYQENLNIFEYNIYFEMEKLIVIYYIGGVSYGIVCS